MRTLLTGASGYIGLHILRELLADGHEITAVVRAPERLGPFARHPRVRVIDADLERGAPFAAVLPGHEVCIHAARIWGAPGTELEVRDVAVTARLFDAAGSAGLQRCIYLSSAAVHRPFGGEMSEEDVITTADLYGATKAAGELFLRAACARHRMTGVVLRPGPVVGPPAFPGASFRTPDRLFEMVQAAAEGRPIETVKGEGRQFSDVSTVARAVRLLARAEDPYPSYVCVDRNVLTWNRAARMAVASTNSQSSMRSVPGETAVTVPRFRTDRIESLLGGQAHAEGALLNHIRHLARQLTS